MNDDSKIKAVSEAQMVATLHNARLNLDTVKAELTAVEQVISEIDAQREETDLDVVKHEWEALTLMSETVECSVSDILVALGDGRESDIAEHKEIMERRSAIEKWRTERLKKWARLGYWPLEQKDTPS